MRVTRRASRRRGGYSVLTAAAISQRGRHAGRGSLFAQWRDFGDAQEVQCVLFQVRGYGYAWMHVIYAMRCVVMCGDDPNLLRTWLDHPPLYSSSCSADCVRFKATVVQYIGELCRYLVAAPDSPFDAQLRLR